ncbi:MAG: NPCBM/NEW2 domain-containing protein [Gemmataceae bacterium]
MFALYLTVLSLSPAASPPMVTDTASGEPMRGQVQALDKDWSVTLAGEPPARIAGADLIALHRADAKLPPYPGGAQVVFANGDRLAGEVVAIVNERVTFKARLAAGAGPLGTQELSIPLSALAVVWFQSPTPEVARRWQTERRRRDVVLLNNGDSRTGTILGLKSAKDPLVLNEAGQDVAIDFGNIVALGVNTDLARTLRPRGQYARLVLANGGRLSLAAAEADDHLLTGRTLFGAEVRIPWDQIPALRIFNGKAVYLSDLKPKAYQFTPFGSEYYPYQMDRSVDGGELRLTGNTYDKGVGLHSECRLTFSLGGAYRRFESLVGLNQDMGRQGSVRVHVLVDGVAKEISDQELTAANGPRAVRVDVTGGQELTLIVEFGNGGPVQDHVDWANARLVK